jgi:hypothetical protein
MPKDPEILGQPMLIDLSTQLDKTNRPLRQLLEARHRAKSEQLSPDQLQLFVEELKKTSRTTTSFRPPMPPLARQMPNRTTAPADAGRWRHT